MCVCECVCEGVCVSVCVSVCVCVCVSAVSASQRGSAEIHHHFRHSAPIPTCTSAHSHFHTFIFTLRKLVNVFTASGPCYMGGCGCGCVCVCVCVCLCLCVCV